MIQGGPLRLAAQGAMLLRLPPPVSPMGFVASRATDWNLKSFVKVPFHLIVCDSLTPNAKLLLMFLINQIGYKAVALTTIDRCLSIHRSTRIRCMTELKELGFIAGSESHIVVNDPQPILAKLKAERTAVLEEVSVVINRDEYIEQLIDKQTEKARKLEEQVPRDFLKEATDAWNRYRPKDYQRIRRISATVLKALEIHMKDLGVAPHNYEEFFSILKSGVEKSNFWSNQNTNKTLLSITGVGSPTDKKRSNVYSLFNAGVSSPAAPTEEKERDDTIVYPASYRPVINDYEAAQHAYNEAYRSGTIDEGIENYVIRTERALKDIKLDPAKFRLKYGMKTWPTDTPEPEYSREIDWIYDDERGYTY